MTERKPFPVTSIVAVAAVLAVLLGGYVGGYLWLADVETVTTYEINQKNEPYPLKHFVRVYRIRWAATMFSPLARIETAMCGQDVKTRYYRDNDNLLPYVQ